jgi:site-specific DNA recombinase
MRPQDTLQVALYARVSSEQQAEAGTIASQVAALRDRVRQDGLQIGEDTCFTDDGYSGATLVRPALERLRDLAAAGGLDRLYVHSPDRLARKYAYQVVLMDEFRRAGVDVVFLNRAVGRTPEDEMLLQVQGMVAEYERAKLQERCRRGKLHAARQGAVSALAGAPYGYRYVTKAEGDGAARYDVLLEEARAVRQMFEWVGRDRLSLDEVCRRLRGQGVRTRGGREHWDHRTVWDILRNPAYVGRAVFGKTRTGPRRTSRLRPARGHPEQPRRDVSVSESEGPGVVIAVPALVSEELFAAVAEQLEENRRRCRQSRRGARWLLQGLLVCSHCGYCLYGLASPKRLASGAVKSYDHYRCMGTNASRFGGKRLCPNRQVKVAALDAAVWADVCRLLRDPAQVEEEYRRREAGPAAEGGVARREQVDSQIKKVKKGIGRLIDAYGDGLMEKEEFEPRIRATRERLAGLEAEAQALADAEASAQELRLVLGRLEEFAARVTSGLEEADWQTRREIIRALVKRVEVGQDDIRIVYRVSPPPFVESPPRSSCKHRGGHQEPADSARGVLAELRAVHRA